jgi:hypothetical protein
MEEVLERGKGGKGERGVWGRKGGDGDGLKRRDLWVEGKRFGV